LAVARNAALLSAHVQEVGDGLDLTLVLDCRIWVVSGRSAQDGATFGNTAKAISRLHSATRRPSFDRACSRRAQLGMRNLLTIVLEANDE
jgi:hypothetical protein